LSTIKKHAANWCLEQYEGEGNQTEKYNILLSFQNFADILKQVKL